MVTEEHTEIPTSSMKKRRILLLVVVTFLILVSSFYLKSKVSMVQDGERTSDVCVFHKKRNRSFKKELERMPCVYTFNERWRLNRNVCEYYFNHVKQINNSIFQLHKLKTPYGLMPIYTHDPNRDGISGSIAKNSEHEGHVDITIMEIMEPYPNAVFIDIGANIGVRTLPVLKSGRKVISIEAFESNIQCLCLSSSISHLSENITIVHNALSNKHGYLQFAIGSKGDLGGNFVVESKNLDLENLKKKWDGKTYYKTAPKMIPSAMLNDITELPTNAHTITDVFVKLDVEGYEDVVLKQSKVFFKTFHIIGMILEWRWHIPRDSAKTIIDLMNGYKMLPYTMEKKKLYVSLYRKWPPDVLWLPEKSK